MLELGKKMMRHASGILTAQIAFVLFLTAAALLIGKNLFLQTPSGRGMKIHFTVRYQNYAANYCQLSYRTADGQNWRSLPPFHLEKEEVKVCARIPEKSLSEFRLDFGISPGHVVCRDFIIKGKNDIFLKDAKCIDSGGLTDIELFADGLRCSSAGKTPGMFFRLNVPVMERKPVKFDFAAFLIVAVPVFLVAVALSRIVSAGKPEKDWFYWVDGGMILLIAVALFIPMSHTDGEKISVAENRKLAEYQPPITHDGKLNLNFGRNFDAWFNDHFYGRKMLLRISKILFSLTRSPLQPYERVYCGFAEWYFYSGDNALRNFHNLDTFTDKQLSGAVEDLKKIICICEKENKKLYFVIVPDKHKVYGEYFPGAPKIHPDSMSRARQLERYLKQNGIDVIYLLDVLLENKKRDLLYWKTDSHWNKMGAYIGYSELMRHIRKDFPDIPPCEILSVEKELCRRGDIVALSNDLIGADHTLYPAPRFVKKYESREGKRTGNDCVSCHVYSNTRGKYKLLMLRDSFAVSLLPYLANSFASIVVMRTVRIPENKIAAFRNADVVIFECVERLLPAMLEGIHETRCALEKRFR